jgi:hypothetical protein
MIAWSWRFPLDEELRALFNHTRDRRNQSLIDDPTPVIEGGTRRRLVVDFTYHSFPSIETPAGPTGTLKGLCTIPGIEVLRIPVFLPRFSMVAGDRPIPNIEGREYRPSFPFTRWWYGRALQHTAYDGHAGPLVRTHGGLSSRD